MVEAETDGGDASGDNSGVNLQGAKTTAEVPSDRRRRRKGKGKAKEVASSGAKVNATGASSSSSVRTTGLLIPHQVFQHSAALDAATGQEKGSGGNNKATRDRKKNPRRRKKKSSEANEGDSGEGDPKQVGNENEQKGRENPNPNPNALGQPVGKKGKTHRIGKGRGGRGGGAEGEGEGDKPQSSKRKGKKEKRSKWWKSLTETDPITLEPLSQLRYEPFGIDSSGMGVYNWFDGKILSNYLVSTCVFANPMTNLPLTRDTCLALDLYLIKHRLGKPCVAKMFDYTEEKKKNAAQDPMPQSVRNLQEEANAIMNALFSGTLRDTQRIEGQRQRQPSRRQPPRSSQRSSVLRIEARPFNPNGRRSEHVGPFQSLAGFQRIEESGHSMIDDDIGLIPNHHFQHRAPVQPVSHFPPLSSNGQASGVESLSSNAGEGVVDASSDASGGSGLNWLSRVRVESEVGGGEDAGPSTSTLGTSARPSDVMTFPKRAGGESMAKGKEAISSYEMALIEKLESLVVEEPGAMEERRRRKQQLADAFGVGDPDRPSQFALSSASTEDFPEDVVAYAAEHLSFVVKVERVVQYFSVQVTTKRLALPPMSNMQRKVVHVVCNLFKVVSQSYGAEPSRWIDLMKSPSPSVAPVKSLSEMARAKLSGKVVELSDPEKWEIQLADIDPDVCDIWVLKEILLYQMHIECESIEFLKDRRFQHAKNLKTALVTFATKEAWNQAKHSLGGGMRGIFVVKR